MGKNVALVKMTQEIDQEKQVANLTFDIDLINAQGELITNLETKLAPLSFANGLITEKMFDSFENRWTVGQVGRVFAATDRDNYVVKVWDSEGKLDRVVTREYKHYKRSSDEKKKQENVWKAFLQRVPNATLEISDNDKDIQTVYTRDDGSLWVLSSRGARNRPEGSRLVINSPW